MSATIDRPAIDARARRLFSGDYPVSERLFAMAQTLSVAINHGGYFLLPEGERNGLVNLSLEIARAAEGAHEMEGRLAMRRRAWWRRVLGWVS